MRDKEDVSKLEILPPPEALLNRSIDSAFHNNTLKVHKRENFLGSDFEFCTFYS
jgi:hypothetical protein